MPKTRMTRCATFFDNTDNPTRWETEAVVALGMQPEKAGWTRLSKLRWEMSECPVSRGLAIFVVPVGLNRNGRKGSQPR